MGELKFQYIGSDLYSRIKWLEIYNLTSWSSWSLRKIGANQPQRHLLHSLHVCSEWCTEGCRVHAKGVLTFLQDYFSYAEKKKRNKCERCNRNNINKDLMRLLKCFLCLWLWFLLWEFWWMSVWSNLRLNALQAHSFSYYWDTCWAVSKRMKKSCEMTCTSPACFSSYLPSLRGLTGGGSVMNCTRAVSRNNFCWNSWLRFTPKHRFCFRAVSGQILNEKKKLAEVSALMYGLNIVCVERSGVRRSAPSRWLARAGHVPWLNSLLFGCSR